MKLADIRKLTTSDLTKQSSVLREEITELKQSAQIGQSKNVRLVRNKRKDLARMLTVLSEQLSKEKI